jgi:thiamine biosynthesis lipoprotein
MNNYKKQFIEDNFRVMGTDVSVGIVIESFGHSVSNGTLSVSEAQKAIEEARNIFTRNEKIFSRFDDASELSKINKNIGKEIKVSDEMLAVLELCLKFNRISTGYFDPRVINNLERIGYDKDFRSNDFNSKKSTEIVLEKITNSLEQDLILNKEKKTVKIEKRIDTTGIAKGWTVDRVAEYLKQSGCKNFIVDAGGDMFATGLDANNENWKIGIEGLDDDKVMLKLNDEGIATSGISRKRWQVGEKKFHHLINPKDPEKFSYDIKTVTVIDAKTVEADGRAKVLVIMGKEKGLQFADENNIKALFLDYRGNVYLSKEIKKCLI